MDEKMIKISLEAIVITVIIACTFGEKERIMNSMDTTGTSLP